MGRFRMPSISKSRLIWNLICITSSNVNAFKIIKYLNILPSFGQLNIENRKRSHRIGKFNILSVNVILFQGNQKNIILGSAFRGGKMPILICLQKNSSDFQTIGETKAQFLVTHGCFPNKPIVFEIYVEFGAFWYQIFLGSKNFAFGLMPGKFEKFGLKALCVSWAFIVRVAEALDHESTNEDFRGCSRDDKPVFIEEINK